jgi:hypothetical protein
MSMDMDSEERAYVRTLIAVLLAPAVIREGYINVSAPDVDAAYTLADRFVARLEADLKAVPA